MKDLFAGGKRSKLELREPKTLTITIDEWNKVNQVYEFVQPCFF